MPVVAVSDSGITAQSLEEAIVDIAARYVNVFGADLAFAPQTPQGQLVGLQALINTEVGEAFVEFVNALSVETARGAQLDNLGGLLDARRRPASRSTVVLTLTGAAGVAVPEGSLVASSAGDQFRLTAEAVLAPTGVTVEAASVETGPVAAAAGVLTTVVTPVAGWETVTNAAAAVPGRAAETDAEFRISLRRRAGRQTVGTLEAVRGSVLDAGAYGCQVRENRTAAAVVSQGFPLAAHGLLIIAAGGASSDLTRAIEQHRPVGVPVMAVIVGGSPNITTLDAVTAGSVTWDGTAYSGLDLSSANTNAKKAAALTTLLANASTKVTVAAVDSIFVAAYTWLPSATPAFGAGSVETAFGLAPASSTAPPGPFLRPRTRELTVTVAVTRQDGFPADGIERIRTALVDRVELYAVGEQVWSNDLLAAAEGVPGTRVTSITVQHNSANVSGVAAPLDGLWSLPAANLTVTVT